MKGKHEELFKLIRENPDLPIVPMVDHEICAGEDHSYWLGSWGSCRVDEYLVTDERVYFKSNDYDDLVEEIIEKELEQYWDVHHPNYDKKTDKELEIMGKEIVDNNNWVKCIAIYIELP